MNIFSPIIYESVYTPMPLCAYGGQRTTCKSRVSPSITWVLGIELGSLGLAESSLTGPYK